MPLFSKSHDFSSYKTMKKKISEDQKLLLEIQAWQRYDHIKQDEEREKWLNKWQAFASYLEDLIMKGN